MPPYRYHVLKWGQERAGNARRYTDTAAALRGLVQAGRAIVDGTARIGGVSAYKLTVTGAADRFLNGTAYVAQSTYHPLEIDTSANGGERIVYQTYDHLPVTAANLRRLAAGG